MTTETSPYSRYVMPKSHVGQTVDEGADMRWTQTSYSKPFGFKKLGLHHITLPPHSRTSRPHAESLEEEFVFVVSGSPHIWIDGYVYEARPHVAVGFPAGTGIAHCVINNTDSDVELLVFGERSKNDNLCSFPVNPEIKADVPIWWDNPPKRTLGPHKGWPGPVKKEELGGEWPSFMVDCTQLKKSTGWHYAGDTETFSQYSRLTDPLGLKALGIGYEVLLPGTRSAFPHAHLKEEEFVYVLSGKATIWMNGYTHEAFPGTAIGFEPGTNISHSVLNDTNEPVTYMVVGEAGDDDGDLIIYPGHPFRNEQCRKQDALWEDRPKQPIGPHDGRPRAGLGDHLALHHATSADESTILDLFKRSPEYFRRVDGCVPSLQSVQNALTDGPEKRSANYKKETLLITHKDQPVGFADIHHNHPEDRIAYLGLLLVPEDLFGQNYGRRSYELIEDYAKRVFSIGKIKLGVSDDNDVSGFWKKLGFEPSGKTYEWKGENKSTKVTEYEKLVK